MEERCVGEFNYKLGGVLSNIQVTIILGRLRESIGQCPELIGVKDMHVNLSARLGYSLSWGSLA